MDKWFIRCISRLRVYRSTKLQSLAKLCIKTGISANLMTTFSLLSGVCAIYFLFSNYWYFLVLGILHLLFDSLDGVIARLTTSTKGGEYFDWTADSVVAILTLAKTGWFLQDVYVYIVTVLFTIGFIIFITSRLQAPLIFVRTASLLMLFFATSPGFPYTTGFLTFGYLGVGVCTVYSLAKQLQWFMKEVVVK
jgi:phosphatidylglycerophosphate synthase